MDFTLGGNKRLKSRKKIQRLFESGKKIHKYPISAVFYFDDTLVTDYQIAVSVPKRLMKRSVDRNLLKRRMREAFRLNQSELKLDKKVEIMFIYTSSEILEYQKIEKSILYLIAQLNSLSNDSI